MSLGGGVTFFDNSLSLFENGITAAASSNTAAQNLCLGFNPYYRWESSGSDDSTTETLVITFPSPVSISRLILLDHNLKEFTVTTTAGSFSNVIGLDPTGASAISETDYDRNTAYYEFSPITVSNLTLTMEKTQIVDQEKFIGQIIATNELGTLRGFPDITAVGIDRDITKDKTLSGKYIIQKGYEQRSFSMRLINYPYQDDLDLLDSLHVRENPFLVWLCGGKPDTFKLKQRGWRINDIIKMQVDSSLQNGYEKNVYTLGATGRYSFEEVV